ncbi:MAG: radical SAM protein [Thermodesulfobacteriota bacterium]
MAKVLLINPSYFESIFGSAKVRPAISEGVTPLGLVSIASPLREKGHSVTLIDLNISKNPALDLQNALRTLLPDIVGITAATPVIKKAYRMTEAVKQFSNDILVVVGGPHPSALPEQVLTESRIDFVVQGQGDYAMSRIADGALSSDAANVYLKTNGSVTKPTRTEFVTDLDNLPFPAYDLLDISRYCQPKIASRREPLGYLETSRGCYGRCVYCNKNIHGNKIRAKSPTRTVDEIEWMLGLGFREIQIIDDNFTANKDRAYAVCEEILRRGLKFPWYPRGGIRVDRIDLELLRIMRRAGCYRIPFGVESGSQRVLDEIRKGITLEQVERAVSFAKQAGMETECYFILGLPTETEEDLTKTVDFAIKLDPDYAKFPFMVPLPGTPVFDRMMERGQIRTFEWEKYTFATPPEELAEHDVLSWEVIKRYEALAYRKFYFRPRYIMRTLTRTITTGTFLDHLKGMLKIRW